MFGSNPPDADGSENFPFPTPSSRKNSLFGSPFKSEDGAFPLLPTNRKLCSQAKNFIAQEEYQDAIRKLDMVLTSDHFNTEANRLMTIAKIQANVDTKIHRIPKPYMHYLIWTVVQTINQQPIALTEEFFPQDVIKKLRSLERQCKHTFDSPSDHPIFMDLKEQYRDIETQYATLLRQRGKEVEPSDTTPFTAQLLIIITVYDLFLKLNQETAPENEEEGETAPEEIAVPVGSVHLAPIDTEGVIRELSDNMGKALLLATKIALKCEHFAEAKKHLQEISKIVNFLDGKDEEIYAYISKVEHHTEPTQLRAECAATLCAEASNPDPFYPMPPPRVLARARTFGHFAIVETTADIIWLKDLGVWTLDPIQYLATAQRLQKMLRDDSPLQLVAPKVEELTERVEAKIKERRPQRQLPEIPKTQSRRHSKKLTLSGLKKKIKRLSLPNAMSLFKKSKLPKELRELHETLQILQDCQKMIGQGLESRAECLDM